MANEVKVDPRDQLLGIVVEAAIKADRAIDGVNDHNPDCFDRHERSRSSLSALRKDVDALLADREREREAREAWAKTRGHLDTVGVLTAWIQANWKMLAFAVILTIAIVTDRATLAALWAQYKPPWWGG